MSIKIFEFNCRQNDGIIEKIKLIKKSRNIRHLFFIIKGFKLNIDSLPAK